MCLHVYYLVWEGALKQIRFMFCLPHGRLLSIFEWLIYIHVRSYHQRFSPIMFPTLIKNINCKKKSVMIKMQFYFVFQKCVQISGKYCSKAWIIKIPKRGDKKRHIVVVVFKHVHKFWCSFLQKMELNFPPVKCGLYLVTHV